MFGLDLLMPLIENSSNAWGTGDAAAERQRKDARYDYAENERAGIQARVEGAKAAGLHPLAALGFQAGASPAIPVGASSWSGASFADRSAPKAGEVDQDMRAAQLRLMSAQAADLETQAAQRSTNALARQPGNAPAYPTDPENLIPGQGSYVPGVRIKPNEIVSSINGREVGINPTLASGRGSDGTIWNGLSEWGLKQTEDMEMLRMGLFAYLNRENIGNYARKAAEEVLSKLPALPKGGNAASSIRRNTPRKGPQPQRRSPRGGASGSW